MTEAAPVTWTTASAEETTACGQRLGTLLQPGDVVALDGPLGAGKTQFVRGLSAGLGLDPGDVSSPTFVMMQEYEPAPAPADPKDARSFTSTPTVSAAPTISRPWALMPNCGRPGSAWWNGPPASTACPTPWAPT